MTNRRKERMSNIWPTYDQLSILTLNFHRFLEQIMVMEDKQLHTHTWYGNFPGFCLSLKWRYTATHVIPLPLRLVQLQGPKGPRTNPVHRQALHYLTADTQNQTTLNKHALVKQWKVVHELMLTWINHSSLKHSRVWRQEYIVSVFPYVGS